MVPVPVTITKLFVYVQLLEVLWFMVYGFRAYPFFVVITGQ